MSKIIEYCENGHVYEAAHNHDKCAVCGMNLTLREQWDEMVDKPGHYWIAKKERF